MNTYPKHLERIALLLQICGVNARAIWSPHLQWMNLSLQLCGLNAGAERVIPPEIWTTCWRERPLSLHPWATCKSGCTSFAQLHELMSICTHDSLEGCVDSLRTVWNKTSSYAIRYGMIVSCLFTACLESLQRVWSGCPFHSGHPGVNDPFHSRWYWVRSKWMQTCIE